MDIPWRRPTGSCSALLDDVIDGSIATCRRRDLLLLQGDGDDDHRNWIERELAKHARTGAPDRGGHRWRTAHGSDQAPDADHRQKELEHGSTRSRETRVERARQPPRPRRVAGEGSLVASRPLNDPTNARTIVSSLLKGRVTFAPLDKRSRELRGTGTLTGLFTHALCLSAGLLVPNEFEPVFWLKGATSGPLDDGGAGELLMILRCAEPPRQSRPRRMPERTSNTPTPPTATHRPSPASTARPHRASATSNRSRMRDFHPATSSPPATASSASWAAAPPAKCTAPTTSSSASASR